METNKEKIYALVEEILDDSYRKAHLKIEQVLNSGVVGVESWDEKFAPMILPKTIVVAILETEAAQYMGRGTSYEKRIRKNAKNIKLFI